MKPTDVDAALQQHTPVMMVPLYGEFEPLHHAGHRFLAARNGLWLEVRRPWLHLVWPLARQVAVPMPFGQLEQKIEVAFGRLPMDKVRRFLADAVEAYPREVGGVVVWNERTGDLDYRKRETVEAGVGHLRALWPTLGDGEHVVIDMHSHGSLNAFFSDTDRADTGTEVMIAGVVGRVASGKPHWTFSIFACGLEIPVVLPPSLRSDEAAETEDDGYSIVHIGEPTRAH